MPLLEVRRQNTFEKLAFGFLVPAFGCGHCRMSSGKNNPRLRLKSSPLLIIPARLGPPAMASMTGAMSWDPSMTTSTCTSVDSSVSAMADLVIPSKDQITLRPPTRPISVVHQRYADTAGILLPMFFTGIFYGARLSGSILSRAQPQRASEE